MNRELTKEDKWLLVSCLQKSVRKGFVDLAVDYASQLYDLERSYLVYRLSIIAVEDVGLGHLSLVNEFMDTEIKKANIEDKGGKEYILDVTSRLASSIKDRTACDLTSLSGKSLARKGIELLDDEALGKIILNNESSLIDRQFALWSVLGAKKQANHDILKKDDNVEKFIQLNEQLLDSIILAEQTYLTIGQSKGSLKEFKEQALNIVKKGYKIHREPHFMAIALLLNQYIFELSSKMEKYTTGQTVKRHYDKVLADDFWLIDGVDWHTKNGKNVIYEIVKNPRSKTIAYLKSCRVNYELFAPLMGTLLFRAVGQQVQERLVYPSAMSVIKQAQTAGIHYLLNSYSHIDIRHLQKIFIEDLPLINEKIIKNLNRSETLKFPF